jgi:DNA mismatch repair ATPase MutS
MLKALPTGPELALSNRAQPEEDLLREALAAAQHAASELRDELHARAREEVERGHAESVVASNGRLDEELEESRQRREELETDIRRLEAMRAELLRDYRILLSDAVDLVESKSEKLDDTSAIEAEDGSVDGSLA